MKLEVTSLGEISTERNYFTDIPDDLSFAAKTAINAAITDFLEDQSEFARHVWDLHAPIGETGGLYTSGLYVGNVRRNGPEIKSLRLALQEVKNSPNPDEWKYPLFVEEGTSSPITSPAGNLLYLRRKASGNIFAVRRSVSGQSPQPTFSLVRRLLNTNFGGIETYNLGRKIAAIIAADEFIDH